MANLKTIINKFGTLAGWNSVTTNMMGRDIEGINQISYDDNVEKENIYGQGSMPIGRGRGNYSAKCSLTLYKEEVMAIQLAIGPGKRMQDIKPFDITVQYEYDGVLYKDRIRNVEFVNNGIDVKQGDKVIATKYDLVVSHIAWNVL